MSHQYKYPHRYSNQNYDEDKSGEKKRDYVFYKSITRRRAIERKLIKISTKKQHLLREQKEKQKKLKNNNNNIKKKPLPYFKHDLKICLTSRKKIINRWIRVRVFEPMKENKTKNESVIGMDTEFDFQTIGLNEYYENNEFPNLIQISTMKHVLLIKTSCGYSKPSENFIKLMIDPNIKKIFANALEDIKKISKWFEHSGIHNFRDCKKDQFGHFLEFGIYNIDVNSIGLSVLCERYLKCKMKKDPELTFSRWSREYLSKSQMDYAIDDAIIALKLWKEGECYFEEMKKFSSKTFQKMLEGIKKREKHQLNLGLNRKRKKEKRFLDVCIRTHTK